jgi:hypothetical protein
VSEASYLTNTSHGRVYLKAPSPRPLKYVKFRYISATQYGVTRITVPMNNALPHCDRKDLIFIQETTLCRKYEIYSNVAVELRYLPEGLA